MRTKEITLYKFEELSDRAKQRALDNARYWNVDDANWDWHYDEYHFELLADIGIEVKKGFYFDLGRSWYITPKDIRIIDITKLTSACNPRPHLNWLCEIGDFAASISYYPYRDGKAIIDCNGPCYERHSRLNRALESLREDMQQALDDTLEKILKSICAQYEYLTSDEAVAESLIANECEFTENGDLA